MAPSEYLVPSASMLDVTVEQRSLSTEILKSLVIQALLTGTSTIIGAELDRATLWHSSRNIGRMRNLATSNGLRSPYRSPPLIERRVHRGLVLVTPTAIRCSH